jgi:hypothetical protein
VLSKLTSKATLTQLDKSHARRVDIPSSRRAFSDTARVSAFLPETELSHPLYMDLWTLYPFCPGLCVPARNGAQSPFVHGFVDTLPVLRGSKFAISAS